MKIYHDHDDAVASKFPMEIHPYTLCFNDNSASYSIASTKEILVYIPSLFPSLSSSFQEKKS
jgi:hypothetical protein